ILRGGVCPFSGKFELQNRSGERSRHGPSLAAVHARKESRPPSTGLREAGQAANVRSRCACVAADLTPHERMPGPVLFPEPEAARLTSRSCRATASDLQSLF